MLVILFLVVGALATSVCLARGHRTAGLVGAAAGAVVLVAWVVGGGLLDTTLPVLVTAMAYAGVMTVVALALQTRTDAGTPRAGGHERLARVLTGALLGSLPGILLLGVPVLLSETGLITADQSQVGFLGLPLVPIGVLVGAALGAALPGRSSGHSARPAGSH
jgi:hypothetical protein